MYNYDEIKITMEDGQVVRISELSTDDSYDDDDF